MNDVFIEQNLIQSLCEKIDALNSQLENRLSEEKIHSESKPEWASQATLAKYFDTSKPSICRYLREGVNSGKIRFIRPRYKEKAGVIKYNVKEVENYFIQQS